MRVYLISLALIIFLISCSTTENVSDSTAQDKIVLYEKMRKALIDFNDIYWGDLEWLVEEVQSDPVTVKSEESVWISLYHINPKTMTFEMHLVNWTLFGKFVEENGELKAILTEEMHESFEEEYE